MGEIQKHGDINDIIKACEDVDKDSLLYLIILVCL